MGVNGSNVIFLIYQELCLDSMEENNLKTLEKCGSVILVVFEIFSAENKCKNVMVWIIIPWGWCCL